MDLYKDDENIRTQNAGYKSVIWNTTNHYCKPVSAGRFIND